MHSAAHATDASPAPQPWRATRHIDAKSIYFALQHERGGLPGQIDELARAASRSFLGERLDAVAELPCDLPTDVRALATWIDRGSDEAGRLYRQYLHDRGAGAPRRYFGSKSHALHFLRAVAPTKLVDGAWLYGLVDHWADPRFAALIRIYLEELGEGDADKNHVVLYRELLGADGGRWADRLDDEFFTQGAIQLALGHHAAEFLPEIIGFNLGYEQLPLHLLITAHELRELGIDPYYFTLHVTVDNASTGHARRALDGLQAALPRVGDAEAFYRRVVRGYKLNLLGVGTVEAIESFGLDRELLSVLGDKAAVGAQLHSDRCRIGGRTVNEWLGEAGALPDFLAALEASGLIRRGQRVERSRFWQLIDGERAPMFGVFDGYERQLIDDWISGGPVAGGAGRQRPVGRLGRRAESAGETNSASGHVRSSARVGGASLGHLIESHFAPLDLGDDDHDDFTAELRLLRERLRTATTKPDAMTLLTDLMSPANHHSPVGLVATRIFTSLFAEAH